MLSLPLRSMGTGIQLEGTQQERVKCCLTEKETVSKRPPEGSNNSCSPLPTLHLKDPARQRTDCPSVAGEGPRGAEATGR